MSGEDYDIRFHATSYRNDPVCLPEKYYGRKITSAYMVEEDDLYHEEGDPRQNEYLKLGFEDGSVIRVFDDGQSCCEHRYMTCDDDINSLVGGTLVRMEGKAGPEVEGEYGEVHDQVFLEIATDKCFITIANHNEHNGYYGGFSLAIKEEIK